MGLRAIGQCGNNRICSLVLLNMWIAIIFGVLYGLVLFSFWRLGGLAAAAEAFRSWGCSAGRIDSAPTFGTCA
jgi:hypothetical protein